MKRKASTASSWGPSRSPRRSLVPSSSLLLLKLDSNSKSYSEVPWFLAELELG
jgi:hypothetical protein